MKDYMQRKKIDALLALQPVTAHYLINILYLKHGLLDIRNYCLIPVFPLDGDAFTVGFPSIWHEPPEELRASWIKEVYGGSKSVMMAYKEEFQTLRKVLREKKLDKSTLGLDLGWVPVAIFEELRALLPNAIFVNAQKIFTQLRAIKTEKEIGFLRRAAIIAEEAFVEAMGQAREWVTLEYLGRLYRRIAIEKGADSASMNVIMWRSTEWLEKTVQKRDMRFGEWHLKRNDDTELKLDFQASYQGYSSDENRRIYLGNAPQVFKDRVLRDAKAEDIIMQTLKPGMTERDAYVACKEALEAELGKEVWERKGPGLPEIGVVLHSIGLTGHEQPWIDWHDPVEAHDNELTFEANSVLSVEPIHIEDDFVLRENGFERITRLPREIYDRSISTINRTSLNTDVVSSSVGAAKTPRTI